ncbi:MAG: nucleoside triphosphate pyrophosphatase [Motiliproteus sp.]
MTDLILASTSLYRKSILEKLGIPFTMESPDIEEHPCEGESAENLVLRLAEEKATAVAVRHARGLVIGSDQVAVLHNRILGKPHTHQNAVLQLKACRSQRITFLTGLSVINCESGSIRSCVEPFHVHFRDLEDQQIETYLKIDRPYDCAGSFKSEGLGISLFTRFEGDDPNTLVGLPLIRLIEMLGQEGVKVI